MTKDLDAELPTGEYTAAVEIFHLQRTGRSEREMGVHPPNHLHLLGLSDEPLQFHPASRPLVPAASPSDHHPQIIVLSDSRASAREHTLAQGKVRYGWMTVLMSWRYS